VHDVSLAFPKRAPIVSAFVANNSVHIAGDVLLHFEVRIDWIRFGLSVGLTFGKGSMSAGIRPSWKMTSKVELGLCVYNCSYIIYMSHSEIRLSHVWTTTATCSPVLHVVLGATHCPACWSSL